MTLACEQCGSETKVMDSRPVSKGKSIRRRRMCLSCKHRQTTYEVNDSVMYFVVEAKQFTDKLRTTCLDMLKSLGDYDVSVEDYDAMIEEVRVGRAGAMYAMRSIVRRSPKGKFGGKDGQ